MLFKKTQQKDIKYHMPLNTIFSVFVSSRFASLGLFKVFIFLCQTVIKDTKEIKVVSRVLCSFKQDKVMTLLRATLYTAWGWPEHRPD